MRNSKFQNAAKTNQTQGRYDPIGERNSRALYSRVKNNYSGSKNGNRVRSMDHDQHGGQDGNTFLPWNHGKNHKKHAGKISNNSTRWLRSQPWQGTKHKRQNQRVKKHGNSSSRSHSFFSELREHEKETLIEHVKFFWQSGKGIQEIVDELVCNDKLCPAGFLKAPDRTRAIADVVVAILQRLKLITNNGAARPSQLPTGLQAMVARLALQDRTPDNIREDIQDTADFETAFNRWPYNSVACAIEHFIGMNQHQLEAIAEGAGSISGPVDSREHADVTMLDDHTNEDTKGVLDALTNDRWTREWHETVQNKEHDPNNVKRGWAFTRGAPKFGEASRFVVRQAAPYAAIKPDTMPNRVRPVANVESCPREFEGLFGYSRHCNWTVDCHRLDGGSRHLFNDTQGTAMYLDEDSSVARYEDADGDTIMYNNVPPWFEEGKDAEWLGSEME